MKTTWKFYLSPQEAWEGMYKACETAKESIDFEQYIFEDDQLGRRFLELLLRKSKDGVRVRLLADAVGSHSLFVSPILEALQEGGVQVQFFNPIEPWWVHRLFSRFLRNHRKILVVDTLYGFIGGVGLRENMKNWRDTHLKISGKVVAAMQQAFNRMWEMNKMNKRSFGFVQPEEGNGQFMLLTNSPRRHQRFTYQTLLRQIRGASRYIYLTTPYFIPAPKLFKALQAAARRGVDVRILLPEHSDSHVADVAFHSYFTLALNAGIKIFEYQSGFIHAKTFVVDDEWASVGSSNLDNMSLLLNYEADVASTDTKFVEEVKEQFLDDSKEAHQVVRREWLDRPIADKLLELLTWPLHGFM